MLRAACYELLYLRGKRCETAKKRELSDDAENNTVVATADNN